jgi:hypothetical protein
VRIEREDGYLEVGMSGCFCCPPDKKPVPNTIHQQAMSAWWRTDKLDWERLHTDPDKLFKLIVSEDSIEDAIKIMINLL